MRPYELDCKPSFLLADLNSVLMVAESELDGPLKKNQTRLSPRKFRQPRFEVNPFRSWTAEASARSLVLHPETIS
jgi:hypothetical protein